MLHDRRRWSLAEIETPAILTDHLTEHPWTPCQGELISAELVGALFPLLAHSDLPWSGN